MNGWNIDSILNVLCFVPFTFFAPFKRKPLSALLVSFIYALLLEVLQVCFSCGAFQISDFIYNALGGLLGSLLYLGSNKISDFCAMKQ